MAKEAVTKALKDAKIEYKEVKQAVVGYCYGEFKLQILSELISCRLLA